jgi:hypothetical protein
MPKQDPQGLGSAMTYLRRYSVAAICGLYQDDDDAEPAKFNFAPYIEEIKDCDSIAVLKSVWVDIYKLAQVDKTALRILEAEKDKRKKELEAQS